MAATLVMGLGGTGCNIVQRVVELMEEDGLSTLGSDECNVEYVVMDTDVNKLREIAKKHPRIRIIQTSPRGTVGEALDNNVYARDEWFPLNEGIMGKPFSEGAAQVRAISRLALDHTIELGGMKPLEEAIEQLRSLSGDTFHQEMRIMIAGSLAGGTGSGILLPVALYLRNYLQVRYQDHGAIIRGLFLEPDTFFDVIQDESERNSLRCNAYATIRELDAFFQKYHMGDVEGFEKVCYNAPQPGSGTRAYYPTLLPYNYVFLVDAINEEGEHLPTKVAYEQHAADMLYAQALSVTASASNSKEDNALKQQVESNGRSRYCGAGVSFLEYPVHMIRRYVALRWAVDSLSNDWTRIDHAYEAARATGDKRSLSDFFTQTFRQLRDTAESEFIVQAGKHTVYKMSKGSAGRETQEEYDRKFVSRVKSYADSWNENLLLASSPEISKASGHNRFLKIPSNEKDIRDDAREAGGYDGIKDDYESKFGAYLVDLKSYWSAVRMNAYRNAEASFKQIYSFPRFEDPFVVHKNEWHFERLISGDEGKSSIHPLGVRYLLYSCITKLELAIESMHQQLNSLSEDIEMVTDNDVDFDRQRPGTQSISETINNILVDKDEKDENGNPVATLFKTIHDAFKNLFSSTHDNSYKESRLIELGKRLTRAKEYVDDYRQLSVEIAAMSACLSYLRTLSDSYEQFFNSFDARMRSIQHEVDSMESDSTYNLRRGKTHRYVCADKRSLKGVFESCKRSNDDGTLPGDLCSLLYREIVDIISATSQGEKNNRVEVVKRKRFESLFEETIMKYWLDLVGDTRNRNAQLLDKSVIEALVDEARYYCADHMTGERELKAAIEAYVLKVFEGVNHLATPFIERPLASNVREITTSAFSPEILGYVDSFSDQLKKYVSELGGEEHADCSKTKVMLYRSVYGFCADDLPKYAPAHYGHIKRSEGEYHRVYWEAVNQLSPILSKNRLVTPHIDKNWHLITHLPDLNETYEKSLIANTFKAFLYGLMWHEFDSERSASGVNFILKKKITHGGTRHPQMELLVSNHTVCDRFYEVYDALTFNPRVVSELLHRYEITLNDELNKLAAPSVEKSKLLGPEGIDSHAYDRDPKTLVDLKARAKDRVQAVRKRDASEPTDGSIEDFTEDFVTDLFHTDFEKHGAMYVDASQKMRMSIFTVPLLYRISLRYGARKNNEIEGMIDGIFDFTREYISNFCDARDVADKCDLLYIEQYLVFEENVAWLESYIDGIHNNKTVSAIRSMVESYFEGSSKYSKTVTTYINDIRAEWK